MKTRAEARRILDALRTHYPEPDTELHYRHAFELLVATILSAQSTDRRVNEVTPALFAHYPDARALAAARPETHEDEIHSTGFFRQKARALIGMATALVDEHGGEVPADMDALTALPGVGRKTANVVLGHALGVPGLPVDRHVLRVAGRLGLAQSDDAVKVEAALTGIIPESRWTEASDLLILHGRRICKPKPDCSKCHARKDCDYFASGGVVLKAGRGAKPKAARARR
ncbi:MAG: endonuclease III [Vicinamibacterales bacterium]